MVVLGKNTPRGNNPNYWCHIHQPSNDIDILADLPEEFSYTAMSHYEGPTGTLSAGLSAAASSVPLVGDLGSAIINSGAAITGGDVAFQHLTKRVWRGTEPIQFSLRLMFDAEENSYDDVHEALTLLASIALPSSAAGFILYAPNPYRGFIDGMAANNRLSIRIGRQYYFDNCVVMSAAPAAEQRVDADGYPIAGAIDLQCCTDYVYSKEDLFKAAGIRSFKGYPGGGTGRVLPNRVKNDRPGLSPVRILNMHRGEEN